MKQLTNKQLVLISFMLFSMFFGAGNLIFPAFLGRTSGSEIWLSMVGFIISAVGLPIIGVIAIAKVGGLDTLGRRISPAFALIFAIIIYISIGPLMAIPRAATVSFEMTVTPFLSSGLAVKAWPLVVYSVLFFCLVLWLSLSPSKLVDRFGKLLTPTLLFLILIIFIKSLFTPLGGAAAPAEAYSEAPFFKGFLDGYLTMDLLASLVFGIVIVNTIRTQGITDRKNISKSMIFAGLGAGALLTAIYSILGYLGSSSGQVFGKVENGTTVLTQVMGQLFGNGGAIILGAVFLIACLCVSIGLVISCSEYFSNIIPRLSYKQWVIVLTVISACIANLGLNMILSLSVPVLGMIYPVAVVLIVLAFFEDWFGRKQSVYIFSITLTAVYSIIDTINSTLLNDGLDHILSYIPLHTVGVGWIMPAIVGAVIGQLLKRETAE